MSVGTPFSTIRGEFICLLKASMAGLFRACSNDAQLDMLVLNVSNDKVDIWKMDQIAIAIRNIRDIVLSYLDGNKSKDIYLDLDKHWSFLKSILNDITIKHQQEDRCKYSPIIYIGI